MPENRTFKQCLIQLYSFLKPNKIRLMIGLVFVICQNVTYAIMPTVEGWITSRLQLDLQAMNQHIPGAHIQMDVVLRLLGILALIYVCKITSQFISAFMLTDAIQNSMYDLRNAIEQKINRLPVSYFDSVQTGDLLSRITNDVETLSNALQQTLSRIIYSFCTFTFTLAMMLSISIRMTLIVLAGMPVIAFISLFIVRKSQPVFDQQQAALARLNSTVNELYNGFSEILIYNQQEKAIQSFDQANEAMRKKGFLANFLSGTIGPLTALINYLVIGICALYGCLQVLTGTLLLGQLQAFIRYIWNINEPITQLSQLSNAIQSAFAAMNRLFTFLDLPEEKDADTGKCIEQVETVDFDHVAFSYNEEPLMKDVDFHIHKGQTVAIVGPTGAGKTTLTNLLLRFYSPKQGTIRINGIDIQELSFTQLRSLFGLVLQDTWLFEGSIEDNLRYSNPQAGHEDIEEAARAAEIDHTIRTLAHGYDTVLNEGATNISQGEKQLLTIARALIKDPAILILDEATSSVDTRLERRLQSAMDQAMEKRTSFVIAHRLSTIVNADLILVMDHGDIVESGTHEELLQLQGKYAALYNSQFKDMDEMD